jgi:hypothetical protein
MAGQGAIGLHRDSARTVRLGARGMGQQTGQRRCLHPGRPYLCSGGYAFLAVLALDSDAVIVHRDRHCVATDFDTHPFQPLSRVALQLLVEWAEHGRRGFDEDDPGLAGVDRAIVVRQDTVRQLGDLADDFDAGRSRTDHDKGEILRALSGIRCQFR